MTGPALRLQRGELVAEARQAQVANGLLVINDGPGERAGEVAFANAGGSNEQDVLVLFEPVETQELGPP